MRVLRRTRSLCPECLRVVDAFYAADTFGGVHMEKICPEHGEFQTLVWPAKAGTPSFEDWKNPARPSRNMTPATERKHGCPFDCGLCPDHARQTCCALIEVTQRCNMTCPVCYASSSNAAADPDLTEIGNMLDTLREQGGQANVQLSGGEPTVREDLPDILHLARRKGFPFVQLNTNGLRLAREAGYAETLKTAGLDLVYLQWDGLSDKTFTLLRGAPYLSEKERAARNCIEAGLSVLFVATVARGVNDGELGDLLRAALAFGPQVRGLHLQPVASFGRYPWKNPNEARLTLPDLMHALKKQSKGLVKATDFRPPGSEHALCSFSALYQRLECGGLEAVSDEHGCCGAPASSSRPEEYRARDFVAQHWGGKENNPQAAPQNASDPHARPDSFDAFLARSSLRQRFTLSAMAFQDAYNLDLERTRRCHIHIVTRDKRLVPFCLYNMTSASGAPLYRKA